MVAREAPDVAIVDVRMPPTFTDEGVRAALELRERSPELAVLVLSQYVEERYAGELLARDARGVGYLLKDSVTETRDFLEAIDRIAAGGTAIDPEVVSQLLARARRGDPLDDLSPREREVLSLMAEGRSNAAIAAPALRDRARGREARHLDPREAPSGPGRRVTIGACSRCCATSRRRVSRPSVWSYELTPPAARSLTASPCATSRVPTMATPIPARVGAPSTALELQASRRKSGASTTGRKV